MEPRGGRSVKQDCCSRPHARAPQRRDSELLNPMLQSQLDPENGAGNLAQQHESLPGKPEGVNSVPSSVPNNCEFKTWTSLTLVSPEENVRKTPTAGHSTSCPPGNLPPRRLTVAKNKGPLSTCLRQEAWGRVSLWCPRGTLMEDAVTAVFRCAPKPRELTVGLFRRDGVEGV